jgi:hypothetical protein
MSEKPSGGGLRERRCVRVGGMVAVVCGTTVRVDLWCRWYISVARL